MTGTPQPEPGQVVNPDPAYPLNPGSPLTAERVFPLIPKRVDGARVHRGR